jgi:poly-gamma-glutamate synthesis protein (capsule biosynthesis protein)
MGQKATQTSAADRLPAPDLSAYPWFYLRDDRPLAEGEPVVEFIAVGDVMLGRGVADVPDPLAAAAPWLRAADLTLGNLESVVTQQGAPPPVVPDGPQPYRLKAPPSAVAHLTQAGFDLLSLANNHSLDYGPAGLEETTMRLQQAGIIPVGAGPGEEAYRPVIRQVHGLRLAFLAFNAVPEPGGSGKWAVNSGQWLERSDQWIVDSGHSQLSPPHPLTSPVQWTRAEWDEARATAAVAAARQAADAVIVSLHWGYEYELWADPGQETAAQALLSAGADVVVGHHPHVAQQVFIDRPAGRLVAYSLGNFVFDQSQAETTQGLALRVFFDAQGLRAAQALPVWVGLRPRLMSLAEAEPLLARIRPPRPRLWFACRTDSCQAVDATTSDDTGASGLFWSGALDLTGDGPPEVARRSGGQVTIYEEGTAVWRTPDDWRVVDVALGDPNHDGRGELLLAIWRPDPDGYERSQPYIVGHRGGAYRLLWGGRPVVSPILEVELGDVDGDGNQEVVVLEDRGQEQSIAVWRWQGWSFSLVWRSPNGHYQDLFLLPEINERLLFTVSSGHQ